MRREPRAVILDEEGMSIVEVMVAMVLAAIVTGVLFAGVVSTYRSHAYTSQDSSSLAALRTALARFEKEVRQARKIYSDSTTKKVNMWVDYDRDNQLDLSEKISWEIQDLGSDKAQLTRATSAAPSSPTIVARNLVFDASATEFAYNNADLLEATLISVSFTARDEGLRTPKRVVHTEVRLRNATAL